MENKLVTIYKKLEDKETQGILFSAFSEKVKTIDTDNVEDFLKREALKKLNKNSKFNAIDDGQKSELINLGFDVVKTYFEVRKINKETLIKAQQNLKNQEEFMAGFSVKLNEFKQRIESNQADTEKVKELNKEDSISALSEMSKIINKKGFDVEQNSIDDDFDDFMNGGEFKI